MNYADIKNCDVANGPGVRVSLFVSGCTHHCKNCFNPETWNFDFGSPFGPEQIDTILTLLAPDHIHGFTLLGGEPFEHCNQQGVLPLLQKIKKSLPHKDIWCYSGYLFEEILTMCEKWKETKQMLSCIDILVDGEFMEEKKDLSLRFKGSSNQRIIQVQKSLEAGKIILWNPESEP